MDDLMKDRSPDRGRDRDRERSRRGDRPSRFSSSTRDRSPIREVGRGRKGDCRVYVSNVAYESKWQDIKDLFRTEVGEVTYVELFVDEHEKPRGCGIVEFKTPELAARAVEKMHRFDLKGRKLVVKEDSDVTRDKFGRPITRGSNRGGDGDGGGSSNANHRRDDGLNQRSTWDGNNQLTSINSNPPPTPPINAGGGGGSGNNSKYGNTYGLSTSFLESLWINGPLITKVFVANLDYKVDEKKLREVFKLAGKVISCDISVDKDGKSRGFGTVEYDHPVEAVQAISLLHNQTLYDRRLTVRMDRIEKPEGPPKLPEGLKSIGLGLGNNGTILHDVPRNLQHCNSPPQVGPTNVQFQAAVAAATAAAQAQLAQGAQLVNQGSISNLPSLGGPNSMAPNLSNVSGLLGQSLNVPDLANLNANQQFGGPGSSINANQSQSLSGLGPSLSGLNVGIPSGLGVNQSGIGSFNAMSNQNNLNPANLQNSNSGFGNNNFETISAALSGNNPGNYSGFDRENFNRGANNMRDDINYNGSPRGLGNGRGNIGNIPQNKGSDTVVVKNLPSNTDMRHLVAKFRDVGEITDVQVGKDTALIRFKQEWMAERAVHEYDRTRHEGRTIDVIPYPFN